MPRSSREKEGRQSARPVALPRKVFLDRGMPFRETYSFQFSNFEMRARTTARKKNENASLYLEDT